jgi:hypothetical protein
VTTNAVASMDDNEHDPTWSSDSEYLAFARGDDVRSIVVVDLLGTELKPFGPAGALNGLPEWH